VSPDPHFGQLHFVEMYRLARFLLMVLCLFIQELLAVTAFAKDGVHLTNFFVFP